MNEFAAKKLGEVLAFCRVGAETIEQARAGFEEKMALESTAITQAIEDFKSHGGKIEALVEEAGVADITLTKADGTSNKLRSMRDLYIGDEWDNPVEVLEWMGFFEGAALVHWALVDGAAKGLQHEALAKLAADGRDYHEKLLNTVSNLLRQTGEKKATA